MYPSMFKGLPGALDSGKPQYREMLRALGLGQAEVLIVEARFDSPPRSLISNSRGCSALRREKWSIRAGPRQIATSSINGELIAHIIMALKALASILGVAPLPWVQGALSWRSRQDRSTQALLRLIRTKRQADRTVTGIEAGHASPRRATDGRAPSKVHWVAQSHHAAGDIRQTVNALAQFSSKVTVRGPACGRA